jgi:hypothetical protein
MLLVCISMSRIIFVKSFGSERQGEKAAAAWSRVATLSERCPICLLVTFVVVRATANST